MRYRQAKKVCLNWSTARHLPAYKRLRAYVCFRRKIDKYFRQLFDTKRKYRSTGKYRGAQNILEHF